MYDTMRRAARAGGPMDRLSVRVENDMRADAPGAHLRGMPPAVLEAPRPARSSPGSRRRAAGPRPEVGPDAGPAQRPSWGWRVDATRLARLWGAFVSPSSHNFSKYTHRTLQPSTARAPPGTQNQARPGTARHGQAAQSAADPPPPPCARTRAHTYTPPLLSRSADATLRAPRRPHPPRQPPCRDQRGPPAPPGRAMPLAMRSGGARGGGLARRAPWARG